MLKSTMQWLPWMHAWWGSHVANTKNARPAAHGLNAGQGLVEYALILVLVSVVVIGILAVLGPTIEEVFYDVMDCLPGADFDDILTCDPASGHSD